ILSPTAATGARLSELVSLDIPGRYFHFTSIFAGSGERSTLPAFPAPPSSPCQSGTLGFASLVPGSPTHRNPSYCVPIYTWPCATVGELMHIGCELAGTSHTGSSVSRSSAYSVPRFVTTYK